MFFMPYNLIISLRNEVIELEISQEWSQIYFMKSIFFFFCNSAMINREAVLTYAPTQNRIKQKWRTLFDEKTVELFQVELTCLPIYKKSVF